MNSRQLAFMVLFSVAYHGYAQTKLTGASASVAENAANSNTRSKLAAPFGAGSLPNLVSNVSVSSFFEAGVNGKIELQGKFDPRWSGGLTIDQKIGSSGTKAQPLDLTGISPGTTIRLNIQKMFWHPTFNLTDQEVAQLNSVSHDYETRNKMQLNTAGLREISLNGTAEEKKAALAAFNSISFREPWFVNAEVGFTKTSFAFTTDSLTLKGNQEAFLTPIIRLSLVKAFGNGFRVSGYAALSYIYAESYAAPDDVTFTVPFGNTVNYYTTTLAFGRPVKQTSHNVTGEYRKNIFTGGDANIAISPSATFGINTKRLSVIVPVYFIPGVNKEGTLTGGLQGGVRFGYITSTRSGQVSSFKNGFIAQLIISQPLNFLDRL